MLLILKYASIKGWLWFRKWRETFWWVILYNLQLNETAGCKLTLFYTPLAHYVMTSWQDIVAVINIKRMKRMGIQLDNLITCYYCHMHLNPEHTRKHRANGIRFIDQKPRQHSWYCFHSVTMSVCVSSWQNVIAEKSTVKGIPSVVWRRTWLNLGALSRNSQMQGEWAPAALV